MIRPQLQSLFLHSKNRTKTWLFDGLYEEVSDQIIVMLAVGFSVGGPVGESDGN